MVKRRLETCFVSALSISGITFLQAVLSKRFDSTAFKKVMPEVYKAYTKQVSSRRFTISV